MRTLSPQFWKSAAAFHNTRCPNSENTTPATQAAHLYIREFPHSFHHFFAYSGGAEAIMCPAYSGHLASVLHEDSPSHTSKVACQDTEDFRVNCFQPRCMQCPPRRSADNAAEVLPFIAPERMSSQSVRAIVALNTFSRKRNWRNEKKNSNNGKRQKGERKKAPRTNPMVAAASGSARKLDVRACTVPEMVSVRRLNQASRRKRRGENY